jgi:hypothetical protein
VLTDPKRARLGIGHVGNSPVFARLFGYPRHHQAESILTCDASMRPSIVNFAQGYPKVYLTSDTRRKRYEFMRSSA